MKVKTVSDMLAYAFAALLFLGILALFWLLWGWVMPQLYPTGPKAFIQPDYWLFVGVGSS